MCFPKSYSQIRGTSNVANQQGINAWKFGFTMIELLVTIAIITVLIGMLLPAVQSTRESARRADCLNNLRNIALACQNYESSHSRIPPGTLGFDLPLRVPEDLTEAEFNLDESHPYFWKNTQHSAALALILPFVDQQNLFDQIPTSNFATNQQRSWAGDVDAVANIVEKPVSLFVCPSDQINETEFNFLGVTTQPANIYTDMELVTDAIAVYQFSAKQLENLHVGYARTNYAGCIGAHSGNLYYHEKGLDGYDGAMTCRTRLTTDELRDGASNTLMFGETIGRIVSGERIIVMSWAFGGVARGRGGAPWNELTKGDQYFLGDHKYSEIVGFGSMHPSVVNCVRADGSCVSIPRSIDLATWYAFCGRADGVPYSTEY